MNESILIALELRFENAKKKAQEYAMMGLTATNLGEKCRNEVEMSYYAGKAEAFAEIITMLTNDNTVVIDLRGLIEQAVEEILQFHSLERLEGAIGGVKVDDSFEAGVDALRRRLLSIIDPKSFDVKVGNKAGEQTDSF